MINTFLKRLELDYCYNLNVRSTMHEQSPQMSAMDSRLRHRE